MKRKIISALLALTMVISMTACGGGSGADSNSGDTAADAGAGDAAADAGSADAAADTGSGAEEAAPVEGGSADENTLTVWTWDPNFNIYAIQKAAEIYAQDHEGFKVEVSEVQSDDIETRITLSLIHI